MTEMAIGVADTYQEFEEAIYHGKSAALSGCTVRMFRVKGIGDEDGLFVLDSLEGLALNGAVATELMLAGFIGSGDENISSDNKTGLTMELVGGNGFFIIQDPVQKGVPLGVKEAHLTASALLDRYLYLRKVILNRDVEGVLADMEDDIEHDAKKTIH